jgi:uncharacterized protein (TIGR02246 family)
MTQRVLCAVTALSLLCTPLAADEIADDLRAAEIAFATSVAEHDAERFASFIDEDAVFLGATVLRGRAAIVQAWSIFFAEDGPSLVWQPDIVEVRPDGLGLSRGPYTLTTTGEDGRQSSSSGLFTSIWRRGEDGSWKVLFDAGCPPCAAAASPEG